MTGLRVLFMVIMFTKLRGLSTSEKSCRFDSSYEIHINFQSQLVATSCRRVAGRSLPLSILVPCVYLHPQGETKTHWQTYSLVH